MKKTVLILFAIALAGPVVLNAAPAPWYHWRSKSTGTIVCSQTPLGEGWERAHGPYRDARCEKLIVVK